MRRGAAGWLVAAGVLTLSAQAGWAQTRPAGRLDFTLLFGEPQGEMSLGIDQGFGLQIGGALPIAADGYLSLRTDLGFMIYGHERQEFCYQVPVGCRIGLDLTTDNAILFAGVGPEVVLARGAIEPYLNASFGLSYFVTTSSLGGDHGSEDFATTTNFSDAVFAWRGGGGVRVRVNGGRKPVYLDLAVERHQNGVAEYLTEGDIMDHPDGSITVFPQRTEANLLAFRMGVSIGIPHTRRR